MSYTLRTNIALICTAIVSVIFSNLISYNTTVSAILAILIFISGLTVASSLIYNMLNRISDSNATISSITDFREIRTSFVGNELYINVLRNINSSASNECKLINNHIDIEQLLAKIKSFDIVYQILYSKYNIVCNYTKLDQEVSKFIISTIKPDMLEEYLNDNRAYIFGSIYVDLEPIIADISKYYYEDKVYFVFAYNETSNVSRLVALDKNDTTGISVEVID